MYPENNKIMTKRTQKAEMSNIYADLFTTEIQSLHQDWKRQFTSKMA